MYEFEFTLWEKAENWKFYVEYKADSQIEAMELMRADYPLNDYRVLSIHRSVINN